MNNLRCGAAILAAVCLLTSMPAFPGDTSEDVEIRATAYKAIPVGSALSLKKADNAELTVQVEAMLRDRLPRLGYLLSDDSPLVLTVGTSAPTSWKDPSLPLKLSGGKGGGAMKFVLFGTNSSGLLQESPERPPAHYRISLSVQDRLESGFLWRGLALICQCGQGVMASSRDVTPQLAEAIGRTIGPQPVAFDGLD